jgi:HEPN domain-containing protein
MCGTEEPSGMTEARRPLWREWIDQAERDLELAREIQASYPESSVFSAQQAAEKAAKALWIARGRGTPPRTHAVDRLLRELAASTELVEAGSRLARSYVMSRYPDAVSGAPFRAIAAEDAGARLANAKQVPEWVKDRLPHE